MKITVPNGPVFLVRDSLNSYKIGDSKQKLQTALSQLTHQFCACSQEEQQQLAVGGNALCRHRQPGWECVRDSQPSGDTFGAGEHPPAAEMLQAASAVARGMVDAPGLVTQGWGWISNFMCGLHWDPVLNVSAPVRSLCTYCAQVSIEFLQKFFEQEFCRSCTPSSHLTKHLST